MVTFKQLLDDQKKEIAEYRSITNMMIAKHLANIPTVLGVLLTGSVARGDARKGPYGLYIDITIVVNNNNDINLTEIFGPSIEPYIPKHCIILDNTRFAFEIVTMTELNEIRHAYESVIFAKQESIILFDRSGLLSDWKRHSFTLSENDIKNRALQQYFRFDYLTCDYRIEKWNHREAWVQMAQNGNEALECYCGFLYCINGWFIPRKDWLAYFTYDLPDKHPQHNNLLNEIYSIQATPEGIRNRYDGLKEMGIWMKEYCICKKWIK